MGEILAKDWTPILTTGGALTSGEWNTNVWVLKVRIL